MPHPDETYRDRAQVFEWRPSMPEDAPKIVHGDVLLVIPAKRAADRTCLFPPGAVPAKAIVEAELPNVVVGAIDADVLEAWFVECPNECSGDDACSDCPPDRSAVKARVRVTMPDAEDPDATDFIRTCWVAEGAEDPDDPYSRLAHALIAYVDAHEAPNADVFEAAALINAVEDVLGVEYLRQNVKEDSSDADKPLLVWRVDESHPYERLELRFNEVEALAEERDWRLLCVGDETEDLVLEGQSLLTGYSVATCPQCGSVAWVVQDERGLTTDCRECGAWVWDPDGDADGVLVAHPVRTCLVHDCDAPATTGGSGKPFCEGHKDLAWPTVDAYRDFAKLDNNLRSLSQGERFLDPVLGAIRFLMTDWEFRNLDVKQAAIRERMAEGGDTDDE